MWQQEFTWFFALFHHEFRQGHRIAFEVLMALAFAHFFGFYNPKQLALIIPRFPRGFDSEAVSYTHLTLPTICSV